MTLVHTYVRAYIISFIVCAFTCVPQIVLWDISAHEDKFQFNKPLQAADTKSNAAAMVRGGEGREVEGKQGEGRGGEGREVEGKQGEGRGGKYVEGKEMREKIRVLH